MEDDEKSWTTLRVSTRTRDRLAEGKPDGLSWDAYLDSVSRWSR